VFTCEMGRCSLPKAGKLGVGQLGRAEVAGGKGRACGQRTCAMKDRKDELSLHGATTRNVYEITGEHSALMPSRVQNGRAKVYRH
jgi:hypothetical protein